MPRQIITTENAPSSPLCSPAVKAGPHLLVSGIIGIDPGTGSLAGDTIQGQARQALTSCQAILQAGGASLDDVPGYSARWSVLPSMKRSRSLHLPSPGHTSGEREHVPGKV